MLLLCWVNVQVQVLCRVQTPGPGRGVVVDHVHEEWKINHCSVVLNLCCSSSGKLGMPVCVWGVCLLARPGGQATSARRESHWLTEKILEWISWYSQFCQDFYIQNSLLRIKKIMTEVLEIISPGSNFSRLLMIPLVFLIIHNMPKKFNQGSENGSTLFALKLILSFFVKDMLWFFLYMDFNQFWIIIARSVIFTFIVLFKSFPALSWFFDFYSHLLALLKFLY